MLKGCVVGTRKRVLTLRKVRAAGWDGLQLSRSTFPTRRTPQMLGRNTRWCCVTHKCSAEAIGKWMELESFRALRAVGHFRNETLDCHRKVIGHWNGLPGDVVIESLVFKDRLEVAFSAMVWVTNWCQVIGWIW